MIGHIIDVEYEDGAVNICKIVADAGDDYAVAALVEVSGMYRFSRFSHTVPKESIAGFYDTTDLEETGLFTEITEGYYEAVDTDSDYETDSECDTDTDVSLDSEY